MPQTSFKKYKVKIDRKTDTGELTQNKGLVGQRKITFQKNANKFLKDTGGYSYDAKDVIALDAQFINDNSEFNKIMKDTKGNPDELQKKLEKYLQEAIKRNEEALTVLNAGTNNKTEMQASYLQIQYRHALFAKWFTNEQGRIFRQKLELKHVKALAEKQKLIKDQEKLADQAMHDHAIYLKTDLGVSRAPGVKPATGRDIGFNREYDKSAPGSGPKPLRTPNGNRFFGDLATNRMYIERKSMSLLGNKKADARYMINQVLLGGDGVSPVNLSGNNKKMVFAAAAWIEAHNSRLSDDKKIKVAWTDDKLEKKFNKEKNKWVSEAQQHFNDKNFREQNKYINEKIKNPEPAAATTPTDPTDTSPSDSPNPPVNASTTGASTAPPAPAVSAGNTVTPPFQATNTAPANISAPPPTKVSPALREAPNVQLQQQTAQEKIGENNENSILEILEEEPANKQKAMNEERNHAEEEKDLEEGVKLSHLDLDLDDEPADKNNTTLTNSENKEPQKNLEPTPEIVKKIEDAPQKYKNKLTKAEGEYATVNTQAEIVNKEVDDLDQKANELQRKIEQVDNSTKAAQDFIKDARNQITDVIKETKQKQQEEKELVLKIKDLENKRTKLQDSPSKKEQLKQFFRKPEPSTPSPAMSAAPGSEVDRNKIKQINEQIKYAPLQLQTKVRTAMQEKDEAVSQHNAAIHRVSNLTKRATDLQKEIDNLKEGKQEAKKETKKTQEATKETKKKIEEKQKEVKQLSLQNEKLEKKLEEKQHPRTTSQKFAATKTKVKAAVWPGAKKKESLDQTPNAPASNPSPSKLKH